MLAVGAPGVGLGDDGVGANPLTGGVNASGADYIFERTGSTWAQTRFIKSKSSSIADGFGRDIALSGDTATLAIGAESEDGRGTGINPVDDNLSSGSGAVYVY